MGLGRFLELAAPYLVAVKELAVTTAAVAMVLIGCFHTPFDAGSSVLSEGF